MEPGQILSLLSLQQGFCLFNNVFHDFTCISHLHIDKNNETIIKFDCKTMDRYSFPHLGGIEPNIHVLSIFKKEIK